MAFSPGWADFLRSSSSTSSSDLGIKDCGSDAEEKASKTVTESKTRYGPGVRT